MFATYCDEVRAGYRKYAIGSHFVFCRVTADGIDVVRILHQRMDFRLLAFSGGNTLADINTALCKRYLAERGNQAAARRELEDLRALPGLVTGSGCPDRRVTPKSGGIRE